MRLRNLATALGALGLVVTPLVAQAANAPIARDASPVESAEDMAGGSGIIIALLGAAAVIAAIVIAVEDEDEPTSP